MARPSYDVIDERNFSDTVDPDFDAGMMPDYDPDETMLVVQLSAVRHADYVTDHA